MKTIHHQHLDKVYAVEAGLAVTTVFLVAIIYGLGDYGFALFYPYSNYFRLYICAF